MFDEQPDGDPHGECAFEIQRLTDLVRWAYSKLHSRSFSTQYDNLKLDEMKLLLMVGAEPADRSEISERVEWAKSLPAGAVLE